MSNEKIGYLLILLSIILIILLINNQDNVEYFQVNRKTVIHKLQLEVKTPNVLKPGFGDFLKGTFSLYALSKKYNYDFYIDISEHPINKNFNKNLPDNIITDGKIVHEFFYHINIPSDKNKLEEEVKKLLDTEENIILIQTNVDIDKYINNFNNYDRFNLQNLFSPTIHLKNKLFEIKNNLNLNEYNVLHIRSGDNNINNQIQDNILNSVDYYIKKLDLNNKKILVLSDSDDLKQKLKHKYNFIVLNSKIIHLGYLNSEDEEQSIESTIIDFYLLCYSKKIYSLSIYYWNSGFSYMASILFNIPIEKYILENTTTN
jgi:hypothetical protein